MFMSLRFTIHKYLLRSNSRISWFSVWSMYGNLHPCMVVLSLSKWPSMEILSSGNQFLTRGKRDEIVAHIGYIFHVRGTIWFEDVEENVIHISWEFKFAAHDPKKMFPWLSFSLQYLEPILCWPRCAVGRGSTSEWNHWWSHCLFIDGSVCFVGCKKRRRDKIWTWQKIIHS